MSKLLTVAIILLCLGVLQAQTVAQQADRAREADRLEEAAALYRKALATNPNWPEGWWYLGTICYDRGDYASAAPAFERASALAPKAGTPLAMLGLSEAKLGKSTQALADLQHARSLGIVNDPQLRHVVLYTLGTLWLERASPQGDYERAQDILDELARAGVQSDELKSALGHAVLRVPLRDANSEATRLAGEAELLAAQGENLGEAQAKYAQLAAKFPTLPNAQFAYGKFLMASKLDDQAVAAFGRELQNSPGHLLSLLGIAGIKSETDPPSAIPYAERAVKVAPAMPEAHYLLGLSLLDTNQLQRAIRELQTASKLAPKEAKIYFALGRAYAEAKRPDDAARARATFTRLNQQTTQH